MDDVQFVSEFTATVQEPEVPAGQLVVGGYFTFTCRNPDGSLAWEEKVVLNGVTNVALNNLLDVYLRGQAQTTTWYLGLVDNTGFTGFSASDTMASHPGWSELTSYLEANRPTYTFSAASAQSITGPAVTFTINASVAIKGGFLVSNNTKGGTSGTLFATGAFNSVQNLVSGQTLSVTYTCSASST